MSAPRGSFWLPRKLKPEHRRLAARQLPQLLKAEVETYSEVEVSGAAFDLLTVTGVPVIFGSSLFKAAGHKYIRREPKPGGGYKYFYNTNTQGALKIAFKVGEALMMVHDGKKGHFHVKAVDGDTITIEHDESGLKREVTRAELTRMLYQHHKQGLREKQRKHAAAGGHGAAAAASAKAEKRAREVRREMIAEQRKAGLTGRTGQQPRKAAPKPHPAESEKITKLDRDILALQDTYLKLTGGDMKKPVRLAELRAKSKLSRAEQDAALEAALDRDDVVMYPEQQLRQITAADRAAAFDQSGVPKHLFYWDRRVLTPSERARADKNVRALHAAYMELTGGKLERDVKLAELAKKAGVSEADAQIALQDANDRGTTTVDVSRGNVAFFEAPAEESQKVKVKPAKPGELVQVGDHIWGSRKDLAQLGRIVDSGQLDGLSSDDAALLIRKSKLIDVPTTEQFQAQGVTPGAARMCLHLFSCIKAKPDASAVARAAYFDGVRRVAKAVAEAKTVDDIKAVIRSWGREIWTARRYGPMEVASDVNSAIRIADQKNKDNPGRKFIAVGQHPKVGVVEELPRPFDALGRNFVRAIIKYDKKTSAAFYEAEQLDKMHDVDAWEALQASSSPKTKTKRRKAANTDRGHSRVRERTGEFIRKGGSFQMTDANPERTRAAFGLREVDFGRYLSQADREHHVKALEASLHDLAEVLGLDAGHVSFNGRIGVALGARGRGSASAHYEPGRKAINITKFKGGGSLGHEWGHALDNIIAEHYIDAQGRADAVFGIEQLENSRVPAELRHAYSKLWEAISKHADPEKHSAELTAQMNKIREESREAVGQYYSLVEEARRVKGQDAAAAQALLEKAEGVRTSVNQANRDLRRLHKARSSKSSEFMTNATFLGGSYWSSGRELFARAFERYLSDKMSERGLENTYLVDPLAVAEGAVAYPSAEEMKAITPAFDHLIEVMKNGHIQKSIQAITRPFRLPRHILPRHRAQAADFLKATGRA